ncbi:MAG TPA: 2OG-Fe(II) oxygenase [Roseomonas sp.]|nr:2OG-Fe(II) oxygenase [Roseomonas sp.]
MTVLVIPGAFTPTLCLGLRSLHGIGEVRESGFMQPGADGKTWEVLDRSVKSRSDLLLDPTEFVGKVVLAQLQARVLPAARVAFGRELTRLERLLVGSYDSAAGGHFKAHRDDEYPGTRHRQVALSVILNDDFEGGELELPELGMSLKPPAGTAVLFECSQLHLVRPVTSGRRFAFVSFLYDAEGEAILAAEAQHIGEPS